MDSRRPPIFSICIPAYNDAPAFERCILSLLQQTEKSIECIVSDDSGDDSIHSLILDIDDERVKYYKNSPALGAPQNWNQALALASGEIISLLHQDDWYSSEAVLRRVREEFEEQKADVLVCARSLYTEGKLRAHYSATPALVKSFTAGFPCRSLVVNRIGHPGVVFFQKDLVEIKYDSRCCYFSDTDYYYRLFKKALKVGTLNEPLVALEAGRPGQLSKKCFTRPAKLIEELDLLLKKHRANSVCRGFTLARFIASNLRRWDQNNFKSVLCSTRQAFTAVEAGLALAALPAFLAHMLYRYIYKTVKGGPWG